MRFKVDDKVRIKSKDDIFFHNRVGRIVDIDDDPDTEEPYIVYFAGNLDEDFCFAQNELELLNSDWNSERL